MRYMRAGILYKKFSITGVAFILALNSFAASTPLFLSQNTYAEENVPQNEVQNIEDTQNLNAKTPTTEKTLPPQETAHAQQATDKENGIQTQNVAPQALALQTTLSTPVNGQPHNAVKKSLLLSPFTYSWNAVPGAERYEFRASQDPNNLANPTVAQTSFNTYVLSTLSTQSEGTWYWQVRAVKGILSWTETSAWSDVWNVTIDNTRPTVTITSPGANSSVRGTVSLSATVNDLHPNTTKFEIYKRNTLTKVYDSGNVSSVTVNQWNSAAVADGDYTLSVTAIDAAGNASFLPELRYFSVDNTAPTIDFNPAPPTGNQTNNFNATVRATDNISLQRVTTKVRDQANPATSYQECASPSPLYATDFSWTCAINVNGLSDGTYTIEATAEDRAGNLSTAITSNFFVDRDKPTVTISSPTTGDIFGGSTKHLLTATGTINDANIKSYCFNAPGLTAGAECVDTTASGTVSSQTWDTSTLGSGTHTITITLTATDISGKTSEPASITIIVDNDAPHVTIAPNGASYIGSDVVPTVTATDDNGPLTYSWTAADESYGDIISDTTIAEPTFSPVFTGTYAFYLTVSDALGNSTVQEFTFTWEPFVPTAPTETPSGTTNDNPLATLATTTPVTPAGLVVTPFNTTNPQVLGITSANTSSTNDDKGKTKSSATEKKEKEIAEPASTNFAWYWLLLLIAILVALYYAYRNWKLGRETK